MDYRTIKKATTSFTDYQRCCIKLEEKAQKYIDWADVRCEYREDLELVIILDTGFEEILCPVEQFFGDAEYLGSLNEVECRSIAISKGKN